MAREIITSDGKKIKISEDEDTAIKTFGLTPDEYAELYPDINSEGQRINGMGMTVDTVYNAMLDVAVPDIGAKKRIPSQFELMADAVNTDPTKRQAEIYATPAYAQPKPTVKEFMSGQVPAQYQIPGSRGYEDEIVTALTVAFPLLRSTALFGETMAKATPIALANGPRLAAAFKALPEATWNATTKGLAKQDWDKNSIAYQANLIGDTYDILLAIGDGDTKRAGEAMIGTFDRYGGDAIRAIMRVQEELPKGSPFQEEINSLMESVEPYVKAYGSYGFAGKGPKTPFPYSTPLQPEVLKVSDQEN
tara:strand:+ start:1722 stop:2639 length:918 start_codon:yes stop_codon:yes gene_type:complete